MLAELKAVDLFTPAITDMDCWLGDASFYDDRVAEHGAPAKEDKFQGRQVTPGPPEGYVERGIVPRPTACCA